MNLLRPIRILTVAALVTGISAFTAVFGAQAQKLPADFNNDGMSELVYIALDRTLVWQPIDVASGANLGTKNMGIVGDHIIMADWLGTGTPQTGIVRVEKKSSDIIWRVRNDAGENLQFKFGLAGDRVVSAADFDKSGAADAVVVRKVGKKLHWFIAYDPLRGGTIRNEFVFGSASENIFYFNPDGAGIRFAALSEKGSATKVRLLNPVTGKRKILGDLPLVNKRRGKKLLVLPLDAPNGRQVIAMVRIKGAKTTIAALDPLKKKNKTKKKAKIRSFTVPANGDVVVGNYLPEKGYEIAVRGVLQAFIVNTFTGARREISAPDGVLVDEFNINQVIAGATNSEPEPQPTEPPANEPPPSNPGSPAPGSLRGVCSTISSIAAGEMLIKSEISKHIHGGDPRATGYTVVCARICPNSMSRVPFYYANGEEAGAVGYYSTFSGNGQPRLYGAAASADQHFAGQIAQRARGIGSGKLYLKMNGGDGPGACKEFEPTGRNGSL